MLFREDGLRYTVTLRNLCVSSESQYFALLRETIVDGTDQLRGGLNLMLPYTALMWEIL